MKKKINFLNHCMKKNKCAKLHYAILHTVLYPAEGQNFWNTTENEFVLGFSSERIMRAIYF